LVYSALKSDIWWQQF